MLAVDRVAGVPYFFQFQSRGQVIDVPVGTGGFPAVVCNPGFQPSRTEGAADINIETGLETKGSNLADRNLTISGC